jgi:hypothetical protein
MATMARMSQVAVTLVARKAYCWSDAAGATIPIGSISRAMTRGEEEAVHRRMAGTPGLEKRHQEQNEQRIFGEIAMRPDTPAQLRLSVIAVMHAEAHAADGHSGGHDDEGKSKDRRIGGGKGRILHLVAFGFALGR